MNINLNPQQEEAVKYINGPLLILAGAGSGKTSVITKRISHMIKNENIDPYSILAITFTNKAASEMKSRVSKELQALSNDVLICTFHSLCVRILRQNISSLGYTSNFTIYDSEDSLSLVKRIFKSRNMSQHSFNPKTIKNRISHLKNQMISPEEFLNSYTLGYPDKLFYELYLEYENELAKSNALDFDDLILKTVILFNQKPDLLLKYQKRFKYIMVDEYQDTNLVQFKLIDMLASKHQNICVVGDDDQSIYKFRGADITNILNFENHFPNAKQVKLERNYRSTSQILDCANHLISHNSSRKDKKMYTDRTDGEKALLFRAESIYEEADYIVDIINDNISNNKNYMDITVLYRSSYQSRAIEEKLLYANIPYKIIGGISFYSRKEIKDIISYLKFLDNQNDNISLLRIINSPKRNLGASTVSCLSSYAKENNISIFDTLAHSSDLSVIPRTKFRINNFYNLLLDIKSYYQNNKKTIDILDYVLEKTNYVNLLKSENTDEANSRIENIQELRNKAIESDLDLPNFLEEISLVSDADSINQSENYVKLMTIHASKGLEFPVVVICGLEDGVFPSFQTLISNNQQDIEEERRIFYVAITRAIDKLYFTSSKCSLINGELTYNDLSTFIKEIPEDLIENACDINHSKHLKKGYRVLSSQKAFTFNPYVPTLKAPGVKVEKPKSYEIDNFDDDEKTDIKKQLEYAKGDRVEHLKYGFGTISKITNGIRDYTVTVDFDDGNTRNLLAAFSKLKKVK